MINVLLMIAATRAVHSLLSKSDRFETSVQWMAGAGGRVTVQSNDGVVDYGFRAAAIERSLERAPRSGRRLLAISLEAGIDQGDLRIYGRMMQAVLGGDELHKLIGALDVERAIL